MRNGLICAVAGLCVGVSGCNRAVARIPLASMPFPETPTGFRASAPLSAGLTMLPLVDARAQHYGERVAGTSWTACRTDSFVGNEGREVVQQRIDAALADAGLFQRIRFNPRQPEAFVLHTEMDAFCSQAVGFIFVRVAGIAAFRFRVNAGERVVFDEKIEQVVTDANEAYSGWPVGTIEQAMRRTMADSLRVVLARFLAQLQPTLAHLPAGEPLDVPLPGRTRGSPTSLPYYRAAAAAPQPCIAPSTANTSSLTITLPSELSSNSGQRSRSI